MNITDFIEQRENAKRIGAICLLLFIVCACYSQKTMRVHSFRLLENDLSATIGEKRISKQDGTPAALIKIVTPESDFMFDAGTYSFVGDPIYKKGEIWIYVPNRAQKLTITSSKFGVLREYMYPLPIESGRTYELVLDLGVGKYAMIQTGHSGSSVYLDGDSIGVSPVLNHYILFGEHTLSAVNGKKEGSMKINISDSQKEDVLNFNINMVDQSMHYGKVTITTDRDAEILMNNEVKGVGSWTTELREGRYEVETRKVNCDNGRKSFTVRAMQDNRITADAPIPFKGRLQLFSRPKNISLALNEKPISYAEVIPLPVGKQTLTFSRKGYISQSKEYDVKHNETIVDTINLKHIQYLKKLSFYFGASYVYGTFQGMSGHIGGTIFNIDLQLSYMFGLSKSNPVNYYSKSENTLRCRNDYKMNAFGVRLGYQIPLGTRFGFVPQLGLNAITLKANTLEGSEKPNDNASCKCLAIGAKLMVVPIQHVVVYVAPEYDVAMSKDEGFSTVASAAGFSEGGFFCNAGLLFNF